MIEQVKNDGKIIFKSQLFQVQQTWIQTEFIFIALEMVYGNSLKFIVPIVFEKSDSQM